MPKRILFGKVVSNKMDKTVVVETVRQVMHPIYKKTMKKTKKFHAHDESNVCKIGDAVKIVECSPMSKTKTWKVVSDTEKVETKKTEVKKEVKKKTTSKDNVVKKETKKKAKK